MVSLNAFMCAKAIQGSSKSCPSLHWNKKSLHELEQTGVFWRLGSLLSTHVFETRTTTGRGHFAYQDSGFSQTFIPSISNGEKILGNANAFV